MANFNIDYLVVAGGGGGGYLGGGGGAGGYRTSFGTGNINGGQTAVESSLTLTMSAQYTVSVGEGGIGGNSENSYADSGVASSLSGTGITTVTSTGGGGGGNICYGGNTGASGGGASSCSASNAGGIRATNPIQGFAGGANQTSGVYPAGGGGGAFSAGLNNANGGTAMASSITGTSTDYAGGGGGGTRTPNGATSGGTGGGGGAGNGTNTNLTGGNATANTGSGGGGGGLSSGNVLGAGGNGGSGVVILRYPTADVASYTATGLTPTQTTNGTDTILSFTTVGTGTITFTPPPPPTPFDGTRATTPVTGFNKTSISEGLKLPSGDNSNQPVGALAEQGMIRNDTEETVDSSASAIAHYNGTNWQYFAATESPDVVYPTSLKMNLDASNTASYPGTGTTWFDLTSNANNGTINGATWNAGGYFNFDGSNDSVTNNNISLDTSKEFSFCGWVYPTQNNVWQRLFSWGTSSTEVTVQKRGDNNKARIIARVSNSIKFDVDGAVLTNNQWHFIAVTGDGSNVKMYVNNNAAVTDNITGTNNYNNLQLGTGAGTTEYFYGQISKFNVYDKALTQAEITAIYNEGR